MKRLEGGAIERAMLDWRIVVTLVAGLVALGVHALLTMPRQEFPEFTIRQGLVVGLMPGASSTEVEQQLAKPVEEYLFSFQEVNKQKTYSVSREGQLVVFVELQEKVKGAEAPAFWAKLRHGLNEQKMQLPGQVIALVGNNDFGDTSALLLTVTADGRSPRDLQTYLEVLEGHLRRIPETSKLRRYGLQDEVIRVTVDRARLARYGVRPATVWMTLQGLGESPAAARLDADTLELPVHVGKVLRSEKELGDAILLATPGLPVAVAGAGAASGAHVRLRDVATLTREYGHDDAFVRFNGATAVVLSIEMQPGHDITRFGRQVDAAIAEASRELPSAVHVARVADQPKAVRTSVNHFLRDFALAIVSVILVTVLLLPLRVATVAAVTIPITVFITLGVLNLLGVELQTVSLAGLVVVLGMVVDNAIVVIDDHVERLDAGQEPWAAAFGSARELALPVFIATLAIIASYIPFTWFMTGTGGDFVSSLPVTIGVALGASMLVAMFLVPAMCARFIRRGLHSAERRGPTMLDRVQGAYDWMVEQAFRRPALTAAVGVGSVLLGVALLAVVPQQLFPKVDRNQFAVEIYLPQGRSLSEADAVVRRLEQELRADRRVTDVTAFVGSSSPRFHTLYAPAIPARSYAQLIVNTVDDEATLELLAEGERRTANAVPEGWVRWKQLDMQSTAAPIEARLSGEDPAALHAAAARLEAAARAVPGATWVRDDWGEPVQGLTVEPDPDACARLGLSPSLIQLSLATSSRQGFPVATVWEGDYPVRVVLADDPRRPASLEGFRQQYVSSPLLAAAVPLEQVATVRPGWFEGAVVRRNGERTLTVRVDVARGVLATRVQADLEREVAKLPPTPGVRLTWGGEKEDSVEQYVPLTKSLATSVAMIYLLLLFQFRRHKKALVVMLTMPLSLLGAVLGLTVFGFPFGFTAFLGLISLMGIVVRNGIIFVGYAEELREKQGLSVREAALAAGKRRMRPIFLTSAAAAVGVIPLITSGSTLWGPLGALTFMGLLVSMALTLVVLPVAYWLVLRGEDGAATAAPRAAGSLAAAALVLASLAAPGLARAQEAAPLSLADARALARGQSTEVRAAQAEVGAAEETRAAARTAWFPQVTATGSAIRAERPLLELAVPAGTLPVVDAGGAPTGQGAYFPGASFSLAEKVISADVTVTQPLFAGGRILNGNRLASLGVDVAHDQAFLARRDAAIAAEEKYWRLVSLGEKDRTLRAYEDLLAALERQAGDAVQAGLATRSDLLAVRLKRQEAAVDRLRLESGRRLSARDLRRHLGLADGDQLTLADAAPPAPVDPASLRHAGAGRVELRLLARAVEAEGLKSRITAGEGLPTLAIGASAMHLDVSGFGARDDAVVFATVSVPLTGLWKAAHERAAGEERERAAALRLEDGRRLVALDAARSWDALGAAFEAARAADAAVDQAEVELAEKRDQHASGLVTLSDLLEAQVKLHQAEDRRIDARVEFALARTGYGKAMGGD